LTKKRSKIITNGAFLQSFAYNFYCEFKEKKNLLAIPILELAHTLRELNHLPSKLMLDYSVLFLPLPVTSLPSPCFDL